MVLMARPARRARRRSRSWARASPLPEPAGRAAATRRSSARLSDSGPPGIRPAARASAASAVSEAVALRQPVPQCGHRMSGSSVASRWSMAPAAAHGPRWTVRSTTMAAPSTVPTRTSTKSSVCRPAPNQSSARAMARTVCSSCRGPGIRPSSRSSSGTSCQPSGPCSTTRPCASSTQPLIETPVPARRRPSSRSSSRVRTPSTACSTIRAGVRSGSPAWLSSRSAMTVPSRPTRPKVVRSRPMCRPSATVRSGSTRSGTRGRPWVGSIGASAPSRPASTRLPVSLVTLGAERPVWRAISARETGPWARTARSTAEALPCRMSSAR